MSRSLILVLAAAVLLPGLALAGDDPVSRLPASSFNVTPYINEAPNGNASASAIDGERGPRECGALALFEPEVAAALHLLQGLVRSPGALAAVIEAAGPGALAQVGRFLAGRWEGGVEQ